MKNQPSDETVALVSGELGVYSSHPTDTPCIRDRSSAYIRTGRDSFMLHMGKWLKPEKMVGRDTFCSILAMHRPTLPYVKMTVDNNGLYFFFSAIFS